jgi:single-strand DNA-binding protein
MSGMNKVYLLGNLGADPELKMTPGGHTVLKLRLATTESYLDKDKNKQERTEWHHITMWGTRGEALAKHLAKGQKLLIEGRIHYSSSEKDGQKRYYSEVVATDVWFAGGGHTRPSANVEALLANAPPLPSRDDGPTEDLPF